MQHFTLCLLLGPCLASSYQHPHQIGTSITIDEPMLTHHSHPKAMVYIRVHSSYCTFYGFEQLYNDIYITVVSYRVFLLP